MKRAYVCALITFCFLLGLASGQTHSKVDVFAGYSYANVDLNDLADRQSTNGWEASTSGNMNRWFALEGAVSGYYKSYSVSDTLLGTVHANFNDYFFGGGPRLNIRPVFVHALFGADRLGASVLGISGSQTKFATALGGGVQTPITTQFGFRASGDYLLSRHSIFEGTSATQNSFRLSVGLVYSFGGRSRSSNAAAAHNISHSPDASVAGGTLIISALGIRVSTPDSGGAQIVELAPNSPAGLAGIRVGDLINRVDGKNIQSAMELSSVLTDKSIGTKVQIGFMVRRTWQSEAVVTLGPIKQ